MLNTDIMQMELHKAVSKWNWTY